MSVSSCGTLKRVADLGRTEVTHGLTIFIGVGVDGSKHLIKKNLNN